MLRRGSRVAEGLPRLQGFAAQCPVGPSIVLRLWLDAPLPMRQEDKLDEGGICIAVVVEEEAILLSLLLLLLVLLSSRILPRQALGCGHLSTTSDSGLDRQNSFCTGSAARVLPTLLHKTPLGHFVHMPLFKNVPILHAQVSDPLSEVKPSP